MIRVSIADDHPLVREGIKRVLNDEIDMEVINEAEDGREMLSQLNKRVPDISIMDMTMPGQSGLELLKDVKAAYPNLPILILSIHPPERFAVRALKAGASGYLSKASISKELVNAVRKVTIQKRKYITPEIAEQLALQIDQSNNNGLLHENLSDREFEVLCLIAEGKDINSIADELSLSPHTVHTYRARIKEKMALKSDVEMTRYAIENSLIS